MTSGDRHRLLQYAHYHRILDHPSNVEGLELPLALHHHTSNSADPEDSDAVSSFAQSANIKSSEKLALSKDAAACLRDALTPSAETRSTAYDDDGRCRLRILKLEMPLLRSDHELDVAQFIRRCQNRRIFHGDAHPALCEVAVNNNEGLQWPNTCRKFQHQWYQRLHRERLEISGDALALLASTRDVNMEETGSQAILADMADQKGQKSGRMTSPLLPASPPHTIKSSSPLHEYAEPVAYTSPISNELRRCRIRYEDGDGPRVDDPIEHERLDVPELPEAHHDSSLAVVDAEGTSLTSCARSIDWKLEVPLTPHLPVAAKSVSFSDIVEETISLASLAQPSATQADDDADCKALFKELIEPTALEAQHDLDHEALQAADSLQRLPVPKLAMSTAEAPCCEPFSKNKEHLKVQETMLALSKMRLHHWSGIGKLELNIPWAPFHTELAQIAVQEYFDGSGTLRSYMEIERLEDILDPSSLTWKPHGLRLLDEPDDEQDAIAAAPLADLRNPNAVLGKRKEVCLLLRQTSAVKELESAAPTSHISQTLSSTGGEVHLSEGSRDANEQSLMTDGIDRFMEMRGQPEKRQRTLGSPVSLQSKVKASGSCQHSFPVANQVEALMKSPAEPQPRMLFPKPGQELAPWSVIVSTSFVTRRNLCRHLNGLWPSLRLVERSGTLQEHETDHQTPQDLDDGDVTVSPSVTIVITTLQKLSQRPLPGRGSETALRVRLKALSHRFKSVLVLVGPGVGEKVTTPDLGNGQAFIDLLMFCATLNSHTQVFLVEDDEAHFARWVVGAICANRVLSIDLNLLQDETYWERFLRRAGMSAFAAQAVLSKLKVVETKRRDSKNWEPIGLTTFAAMPLDDYIDCFQQLLEGRAMLKSGKKLIDARWAVRKQAR